MALVIQHTLVTRINRQSYGKEIGLDSFSSEIIKADVVWGLQNLSVQKSKREVKLKCVKNRYGENYEVKFRYEAAHDSFQSIGVEEE